MVARSLAVALCGAAVLAPVLTGTAHAATASPASPAGSVSIARPMICPPMAATAVTPTRKPCEPPGWPYS